jgi:hypothetical protein
VGRLNRELARSLWSSLSLVHGVGECAQAEQGAGEEPLVLPVLGLTEIMVMMMEAEQGASEEPFVLPVAGANGVYGVGEGGQAEQGAGEEPLVLPVPGAALPDKRRRREIQHTGKLHENISKMSLFITKIS